MRTANWRYWMLTAVLAPALLLTACGQSPGTGEGPTASDPVERPEGGTPVAPLPSPLLTESFVQRV